VSEADKPASPMRLSVRIGDFQVDLEGTQENIKELIGKKTLFEYIKELQKTSGNISIVSPATVEFAPEVPSEEEEVPPLGRPSSTIEALSKLFKTDWGRKPRPLAEIMKALEANGLYYKKPVVAKALVDLIKKQQLRRLGAKGSFLYVAV
jgi:hypothetical protein